MLNGIGKLSSVSTTNVCRRDGDVLLRTNTLEYELPGFLCYLKQNVHQHSGGSTASDKGFWIRVRSPKMFFSAPRASVWSKNKGGRTPGPLPWIRHCNITAIFVKSMG